jgi:hypothetical protein
MLIRTNDPAMAKAWSVDLRDVEYFLTTYEAGPQLLPAYVERAVELYRMFLAIKVRHWKQRLVPSEPVDDVWHSHILMTYQYRKDCKFLFGKYLDHDPMYGSRSWAERLTYNRDKIATVELMNKHFNVSKQDYVLAGPEYLVGS